MANLASIVISGLAYVLEVLRHTYGLQMVTKVINGSKENLVLDLCQQVRNRELFISLIYSFDQPLWCFNGDWEHFSFLLNDERLPLQSIYNTGNSSNEMFISLQELEYHSPLANRGHSSERRIWPLMTLPS